MLEAGTQVIAPIQGELESIVPSAQGLRATIRINQIVSITVQYASISPVQNGEESDGD